MNSVGEGIVGLNAEGIIAFANPAAINMLGWLEEDLIGQHYHNLVHHTKSDGMPYPWNECLVWATIEDGMAYSVSDEIYCRQDRTTFPVSYTSTPIQQQGRVVGAVVIFRDITEQRRYIDRLQLLRDADQVILAARSAQDTVKVVLPYFYHLVRCQRVSVTLLDSQSDIWSLIAVYPPSHDDLETGKISSTLDSNSLYEALTENKIYLTGDKSIASIIFPETHNVSRARAWGLVPLIARDKLLGSINLEFDHSRTLVSEEIEVMREAADHLAVGILQARLNEQVRHHAEELERQVKRRTASLRASQARFQALFEKAAIGIALANRKGRILMANPALEEMLGHRIGSLDGRVLIDLVHSDDAESEKELYRSLFTDQHSSYQIELRYIHRDGHSVEIRQIVSLVPRIKGRSQFAIVLIEDITEQKQAQAALIQSEKLALTGQLAASLAHEINNPLQAVLGCLGLVEEVLAESGDVTRYLDAAIEEIERAGRIVQRLRDVSQGSLEPEAYAPVDVNVLLERVFVLTRKQCQNKRVVVDWRSSALPAVMGIQDELEQVFLNLVLNALTAMPDGGTLGVRSAATSDPAGARVSLSDTGVGMDEETLAHLFEPFYSTRSEGSGLGLFVSQRIVHNHGGYIEVHSQVGQGSTFTIWLPHKG